MINLRDILSGIQVLKFVGNEVEITELVSLDSNSMNSNRLAWCSDKNVQNLFQLESGNIILSAKAFESVKESCAAFESINWIVVEQPRQAFSTILKNHFEEEEEIGVIEKSAFIHPSVKINADSSYIGHHVTIEKKCQIGIGVKIGHGTVIKAKTIIGDHVSIGSNCVIGGVGFGYELDDTGNYQVLPHIGNVELHEHVEIGNNVCIDRAVLGSTILHENVKVDNLVHIAHGVEIGKNSLIIANAMIAGSVKIGQNVWVAPSSSIIQKVSIGDNSLIGLSSTVLKNVEPSSVMVGSPAKKIKDR